MEFFIPGLYIFLIAILCTVYFTPKATPMIAAILSIVFLCYGVYDHYRMFLSEYRLSTWQQTFSTYMPYIMVAAIIIYTIFGILSFFTGGAVPVPSMPSVELPTLAAANTTVTQAVNTAVNSISNTANDLLGSGPNSLVNSLNDLGNSLGNSLGMNNSYGKNNMSRSALETL
jgi:hypothetical protein